MSLQLCEASTREILPCRSVRQAAATTDRKTGKETQKERKKGRERGGEEEEDAMLMGKKSLFLVSRILLFLSFQSLSRVRPYEVSKKRLEFALEDRTLVLPQLERRTREDRRGRRLSFLLLWRFFSFPAFTFALPFFLLSSVILLSFFSVLYRRRDPASSLYLVTLSSLSKRHWSQRYCLVCS